MSGVYQEVYPGWYTMVGVPGRMYTMVGVPGRVYTSPGYAHILSYSPDIPAFSRLEIDTGGERRSCAGPVS